MSHTYYERLSALDASFLGFEEQNTHWHEAAVMGFDPGDYLQSHHELYELLRKDKRDEAVHYWRGHIERFSAEAARHLPNPPLEG